jgi:hypothetical protein
MNRILAAKRLKGHKERIFASVPFAHANASSRQFVLLSFCSNLLVGPGTKTEEDGVKLAKTGSNWPKIFFNRTKSALA